MSSYVNIPATSAAGGFGSDVTVPLANASAVDVTALELIATLTTNTAGSEASQWLHKLLTAGAQVTSLIERPNSLWAPNGTSALPGYAHLGTARDGTTGSGYGQWFDQTNSALAQSTAGVQRTSLNGTGLRLVNDGMAYLIGSTGNCQLKQDGGNGDLVLTSTVANVSIGPDVALTTSAVVGFLEIPTCAGTPTGAVTLRTGKAAVVVDTTNNKFYARYGGAWHDLTGT
jgi:hypothetical protein